MMFQGYRQTGKEIISTGKETAFICSAMTIAIYRPISSSRSWWSLKWQNELKDIRQCNNTRKEVLFLKRASIIENKIKNERSFSLHVFCVNCLQSHFLWIPSAEKALKGNTTILIYCQILQVFHHETVLNDLSSRSKCSYGRMHSI